MKHFLMSSGVLVVALMAIFWYFIAHKVSCQGDLAKIKAPLIIFDFDGTICPSYRLLIAQVNLLAGEYHLRKIGNEEIEDFRDMSPKKMMQTLGLSTVKLPFFLRKIRRNAQKQLLELKPVEGITEVLLELKSQGYSLGILSSNSEENVLLYLQRYKIDIFDFVFTGNNIFGKDKHLKSILKKIKLDPQGKKVVYVGDEIRDMEAARKAGLINVGVSWGYNSLNLLRQSQPQFLFENPPQLLFLANTAEGLAK